MRMEGYGGERGRGNGHQSGFHVILLGSRNLLDFR
jgi:hypothetical protein